jgi:hypothetical protein
MEDMRELGQVVHRADLTWKRIAQAERRSRCCDLRRLQVPRLCPGTSCRHECHEIAQPGHRRDLERFSVELRHRRPLLLGVHEQGQRGFL